MFVLLIILLTYFSQTYLPYSILKYCIPFIFYFPIILYKILLTYFNQYIFSSIIIDKISKKPIMVDFERCHKTQDPKNVTQFSTYFISDFMVKLLKEKGIKVNREKIIAAAKKYKKDMCKKNLDRIISFIK